MKHNLHAIREGTMKVVFLLTACISILAVALICIFLFANGIPTMHKIGLGKFLLGMTWAPNQNLYGIFPMIIASILRHGRRDPHRRPAGPAVRRCIWRASARSASTAC